MDKTVSIVIPVKTRNAAFQQCIQRIKTCSPQPHEIIVVVDGCAPESSLNHHTESYQLICLPESGGPARARNIGSQKATGDILLFIDADVLVPEDIVARFQTIFQGEKKPDAVFGSYDDLPPEQDYVSQYKNLLHHYTHQSAGTDAFTFWTGCGAILRDRFVAMNGFSEQYLYPSVEDIDLGYRMKKTGYTILLDKTIQVTHLKKWSLPDLLKTDLFLRAIPWSKLIFRYKSLNNDMNINMINRLSVMLSWVALACLCMTIFQFNFIYGTVVLLILLLWINRHLFAFFLRKKGTLFMVQSIILHFLYYILSGLGFSMAYFDFLADKLFSKLK